jgi:5-methylcytosine-specific restriction endonuclease McrA
MPSRSARAKRRAEAFGYSGAHFTLEEWEGLLASCGHRCLSCGSVEDLTADHIHPLSLGGSNAITNIQPLCEECNGRKGLVMVDYRPPVLRRLDSKASLMIEAALTGMTPWT